ncbi:hypothetical protein NMY22_g4649 [Coprinellus aureogranulatus]|nr:hypothetical protein NMY22_g4649 [Coprinellus aureogranulatus]
MIPTPSTTPASTHSVSHNANTAPPETVQPEEDAALPAEPMGRGVRIRQPVRRYKDYSLTSTIPFNIPAAGILSEADLELEPPIQSSSATVDEPPRDGNEDFTDTQRQRLGILDSKTWKTTPQNEYHLFKRYWSLEQKPHDPDHFLSDSDLHDGNDDLVEQFGAYNTTSGSFASLMNPFYPFPNLSSFALGEWYWGDSQEKSGRSFQRLVEILTSDDFVPQDLRAANWATINSTLAASVFEDPKDAHWVDDGESWKTIPLSLQVPFDSASTFPGPRHFTVEGFRFRPLLPIIREKLQDKSEADHFHLVPSQLLWQPIGNEDATRVYGELYHSDAFLEAYRDIQNLPPECEEDSLPRCVVALMFASDETMLASFGTAQAWPLYLFFGNISKYRRTKASLKQFEEVAYFQTLPDSFSDWYLQLSGKNTVGKTLAAHLARELFHEQWRVLLDSEFTYAYRHGLAIDCFDGVRRRVYPRILTYAADYPERTTIVSIRQLGGAPCPRCLVQLDDVPLLGTTEDRLTRSAQRRYDDQEKKSKVEKARKLIYESNSAVNAAPVESLLKPTSLVPSRNSFSECLSDQGLDVYDIVSVDILHEVEIGVWKDLFLHLLRILEVIGTSGANILNARFRQVPPFGRDTIRRFSNNVSEHKQMGAGDYEDILQCILPVVEGLFPPEHDQRVQDLVFTLAHWHSFAKLRLHTEASLAVLDDLTTQFGEQSRNFLRLTCAEFQTKELKREYEARKRREARAKANLQGKSSSKAGKSSASRPSQRISGGSVGPLASASPNLQTISREAAFSPPGSIPTATTPAPNSEGNLTAGAPNTSDRLPASTNAGVEQATAAIRQNADLPESDSSSGRKPQTWSLRTSKFHGLGDVVAYIRRFGSTDSYSTQLSERLHRFSKSWYRRTNRKDVTRQLTRIKARQARIKKMRKKLVPASEELTGPPDSSLFQAGRVTYFIGKSQNDPVNLGRFLSMNVNDIAVVGFLLKLKRHLFPRIIARLLEETKANVEQVPQAAVISSLESLANSFSDVDTNGIYFHSDRIYRHKVLQIDFTTYDGRRDCDILNASTDRRDFMCLRGTESGAPGLSGVGGVSLEDSYVYGRLLGVFHANIVYGGRGSIDLRRRRFDFLWVRWFTPTERSYIQPWTARRFDRLSLAPLHHPEACDFLDPADVLRAAHLIPRFASGQSYDQRDNRRLFSKFARERGDWNQYYVNRFVDRDMTMRFHPGLAIGHIHSRPTPHAPRTSGEAMDVDGVGARVARTEFTAVMEDAEMSSAGSISSDSDDFDAYKGSGAESSASQDDSEGKDEFYSSSDDDSDIYA